MRDLELSVSRDLRRMPRLNHTSRRDPHAVQLRARVIEQGRFGRRCAGCDFSFGNTDLFEVNHIDGNHMNEAIDNLEPICELCHCPLHLDLLAKKWPSDAGKIVFLPELSQGHLNNLLQAIFFAMATQATSIVPPEEIDSGSTEDELQPHTVLARILARATQAECDEKGTIVRPRLSDPFVLSRVLQDMTDAQYAGRGALLVGLRYVPPVEFFVKQAGAWNAHGAAFAQVDLSSWKRVVANGTGSAG